MFESFTVGAVFTIRNEAAVPLRLLAEQIEKIEGLAASANANLARMAAVRFGGASSSLAGLARNITKVDDAGVGMAATMGASMEAMNAGLFTAATRARELSAAIRDVTVGSRALAGVAPGGAGGGGRRGGRAAAGGGALYARAHAGGVGAHTSVGMGEVAGIGAGFAAYEGLKGAAAIQMAQTIAMQNVGVRPDSAQGVQLRKMLDQQISAVSQGTMYSTPQVAAMIPGILSLAMKSPQQDIPLIAPAVRFGEYEQRVGSAMGKSWSIEESTQSAIAIAHMANVMDPAKIGKFLDFLAPISAATERSPAELRTMMQYSVPTARGLGMNPMDAVNLTAGLNIGGLTGRTAATGLGQLLLGTLPKSGPGAAFGNQLAASLGISAGSRKKGESAREKFQQKFGFVDKSGKSTLYDSTGKIFNTDKFISLLNSAENKLGAQGFFSALHGITSIQGARAGVIAGSDQYQQLRSAIADRTGAFPGVVKSQQELAEQFTGQLTLFRASMETLTTTLATGTLPALASLVGWLNDLGNAANRWAQGHPGGASVAGAAMEVGGVVAAMNIAGKLLGIGSATGMIGRGLGAGAAALGVTLAPEAAAVIGGLIAAAVGIALVKWLSGKSPDDPTGAKAKAAAAADNSIHPATANRTLFGAIGDAYHNWMVKKRADALDPLPPGYSASHFSGRGRRGGSGPTQVNVGPVAVHMPPGTPADHADIFVTMLNEKISTAFTRNLGGGEGSMSSPYTSGGGP